MMIFRRSRWFPLIALVLMSFLSALSVATQEAFAFFGGSHISTRSSSEIPIGYSAGIHATVKNTGTEWWHSWYFDRQPAWIIVIRDLSWLPNTSYVFDVYYAEVSPGSTMGDDTDLTPDRLPSSEGNYSLNVYAYYPIDSYGSEYLLMDNSPQTVNFTMLPKAPTLSVSMSSLNQKCLNGKNASSQSFEIWNSGSGSFTYVITDDVEWLSVSPSSGSSMGDHDVVQVNYDTSGLSAGTYYGKITLKANEFAILESPQTITVTLRVSPAGMTWMQLLLDGDK
jgi:hypothetical protein